MQGSYVTRKISKVLGKTTYLGRSAASPVQPPPPGPIHRKLGVGNVAHLARRLRGRKLLGGGPARVLVARHKAHLVRPALKWPHLASHKGTDEIRPRHPLLHQLLQLVDDVVDFAHVLNITLQVKTLSD